VSVCVFFALRLRSIQREDRYAVMLDRALTHVGEHGNPELEKLLQRGASANTRIYGYMYAGNRPSEVLAVEKSRLFYGEDDSEDYSYPLYEAVMRMSTQDVKILLAHGANLRLPAPPDKSIFPSAISGDWSGCEDAPWDNIQHRLDIARLMVRHGADVNHIDTKRFSTLDYAILEFSPESISTLCGLGARIRTGDLFHGFDTTKCQTPQKARKTLLLYLEGLSNPNIVPDNLKTWVQMALYAGDADAAKELIMHGFSPDQGSGTGDYSIYEAIAHHRDGLIPLLIHHGAYLDQRIMNYAVQRDDRTAIGELLAAGLSFAHTGVLSTAAESDDLQLVKLAIAHGAKASTDIPPGSDAAIAYCLDEAVLFPSKLDIWRVIDGTNQVDYLASYSKRLRMPPSAEKITKLLLSAGFDSRKRDIFFNTSPLSCAIVADDTKLVSLLEKHGATINPAVPFDSVAMKLWNKRHPSLPLPVGNS
jgi:ankyrin repeat protein